ncbi:MAG TPA: PIN domain-containing protein [Cyclobacteriaceae bacterium]|nr:PIN domain-containing protein [Cyclobacteriaceae bacterium]
MEKVFVDTDVVLDLLGEREPFYRSAALLFSMADKKEIKLFVSALSFANTHYVLRRKFGEQETRKILLGFKVLVTVLPVEEKSIELALASDFSDFEDAVQYYTAIENSMKALVTRNLKDFRRSKIPVMTADAYLKTT